MNRLRCAGGEKKWFFHVVKVQKYFSTAIISLALSCLGVQTILAAPIDDFVTTWKTNNPGNSNDTSITVPMLGGPYDVDWNDDGVFDEIGLSDSVTHDFGAPGTYTIRVRGFYDSFRSSMGGDQDKVLSVDQWGTRQWQSMYLAFRGASNLTIPATDTPNFSAVSSMSGMFWNAPLANPDITGWDTSAVKSMALMFANATAFDRDIGSWNVMALENATRMFRGVTLSRNNYENLLIGWDAQNLQPGVNFSGGNSTFCIAAAVDARANMITSDSWTITDGGQECPQTDPLIFKDGFEVQ